jgi:ABC-type glycerol-3-phosphate transport system permease component
MKKSPVVRHTLTHFFIITLGLLMIYPIVWMIISSFKPNNMIFSDPGLIPKAVTIENYVSGWKGYAGTSFGRFFVNSLLMCAVAIIGNLISCTMTAYAFARLKFVGRGFWFAVMMLTLMLPAHVTLVHLLYLTKPETFTVSRALRTFVGDAGAVSNWGGALAMSTLSMIPTFILFFALQKYFVQGITTTGIKS